MVDGMHATHIFINNLVFNASNDTEISKKLNLTDFKILIWCCNPKETNECGLKNLVKIGELDVKISHKTKYKMHAYVKYNSCTLMDILSMHEYTA